MDKNDIINGVPEGWKELVRYGLEDFEELGGNLENITYIKEKYGGLRFEHNYLSNYILDDICSASNYICVECGKAGKIRYDIPWYTCYCDKHYKEKKTRRN